ncbi:MAG: hypothetical protein RLZZ69_1305, partial [Cyanobacteriota bacterium]
MEESIVEQHREYYPMTFFPECLTEILAQFQKPQLNNNPTFCLEPISICIPKIHYYGQLKLIQFYLGSITVIIFAFSITVSLLFSHRVGIFLFLFNILFLIGYFFIATEGVVKVNKSATALFMCVICWVLYMMGSMEFLPIMHGDEFNALASSSEGASLVQQIKNFISSDVLLDHLGDTCETIF